jgi:hypothetical protein
MWLFHSKFCWKSIPSTFQDETLSMGLLFTVISTSCTVYHLLCTVVGGKCTECFKSYIQRAIASTECTFKEVATVLIIDCLAGLCPNPNWEFSLTKRLSSEFKGTEIVFLNERTISFYTVYYHDSGDIYSERYSENLSCQLNTCQLWYFTIQCQKIYLSTGRWYMGDPDRLPYLLLNHGRVIYPIISFYIIYAIILEKSQIKATLIKQRIRWGINY